ncbi:hypothetical protein ISF_03163 [Cordyceps fumosorosea ARSEF 2679]|uniref:Uncharacterized protein n=1 Tax=Cordyceps fumosorosea (strain ARSEF 2679) TaxID=1081104 RepID=A0A168BBL7_CORFA|nr:hypothetical protein ISF_03163 [Cordyceps fumosorosea ARSEF 2679]OAA69893.1 hypothetical protein ISF_03163 [Cordyceps fumosorosea ARSEF 2679]
MSLRRAFILCQLSFIIYTIHPGGDDELPPPYSPEPTTTSISSVHPDSLFAAHLAAMRLQIREQQTVRASQQEQRDMHLLALLVPHVEDLLASVATADSPQPLAQATLIPDGALSSGWTPTETQGGRVVRVQTSAAKGDAKQQPPPATRSGGSSRAAEFDGWGRWGEDAAAAAGGDEAELFWWKDEELAVRLARHLQPERDAAAVVVVVDRPTVKAKAVEAKKGRSRWNIFGGGRSGDSATPTTTAASPAASRPAAVQVEDDVAMHVTAEEVTFRRENAMGLWESCSGWGVVVRVRIRT